MYKNILVNSGTLPLEQPRNKTTSDLRPLIGRPHSRYTPVLYCFRIKTGGGGVNSIVPLQFTNSVRHATTQHFIYRLNIKKKESKEKRTYCRQEADQYGQADGQDPHLPASHQVFLVILLLTTAQCKVNANPQRDSYCHPKHHIVDDVEGQFGMQHG